VNLFGIGIDVVEVARVESSISEFGDKFLNRIFTEDEQSYCKRQKKPEIHLAARFAAKEAISKAFGTGIGKDLSWLDLEISRRESGEPEVSLRGAAEEFAQANGIVNVKISLTHADHYAAANAVALCE